MNHLGRYVLAVLLSCAGVVHATVAEQVEPDPELSKQVTAESLGQDGHDYVQKSSAPGPNDIQDLHIRLGNLPMDDEIESVVFSRLGGGTWGYERPWGIWKAHMVREPGSQVADFFLEPSHEEDSLSLDVRIAFKSGKVAEVSLNAGRQRPDLLMPNVGLKAKWLGQDGHDRTGTSESVGPDGLEDVRIELSGIGTRSEVRKLQVKTEDGPNWEHGLNHQRDLNAELVLDESDKSRGMLYLSPDRDLDGWKLTLTIFYANEMTDSTEVVARKTDPKKAMPPAKPVALEWIELSANWLGQDGSDLNGRGDVHVTVEGLPSGEIDAVALSNTGGGYWVWPVGGKDDFYVPELDEETYATLPIAARQEGEVLHLYFQPFRDERGANMTLRVRMGDGRVVAGQIPGGATDALLRGALPGDSQVTAQPGDNLHGLIRTHGTVVLSEGEYVLDRPLEIEHPVTIRGPRQAVVRFEQAPEDEQWTYAVLVNAPNVTLDGFTIRVMKDLHFSTHWMDSSALIKAPNRGVDGGLKRENPITNLVITHMDIDCGEVSAGPDPKEPPFALDLLHGESATSGRFTHNRWRGGTMDVNYGPWIITDNVYLGPPPGTQSPSAYAAHWSHDITIEHNRFEIPEGAGKQWRFFGMNQYADRVFVRDNHATNLGILETDTFPSPNMPEILITESYRLYFEGRHSGITNDGRIIHVPYTLYGQARPGSVVSVLNGPHAGTWVRIAQPISPTAFLLEKPLPEGDYDVHVAHGFTNGAFERNTIDNRGGRSVVVLLAGNHWNFRVADNHLLGGGASMLIDCCPTEIPVMWGWSHTVMFDVVTENNVHEDSLSGTEVDVNSDKWVKTAVGRTYLTGAYRDNTFKWTAPALVARAHRKGAEGPPKALRIGRRGFSVLEQMNLTVTGNTVDLPGDYDPGRNYEVRNGTVNGEQINERFDTLPRAR